MYIYGIYYGIKGGTQICTYNLCTMRLKELGGTQICTYIYGMYYGMKGGTQICTYNS